MRFRLPVAELPTPLAAALCPGMPTGTQHKFFGSVAPKILDFVTAIRLPRVATADSMFRVSTSVVTKKSGETDQTKNTCTHRNTETTAHTHTHTDTLPTLHARAVA